MQFTGTLKSWNDDRGFGFIEATHGGQEIFVHIKAFPAGIGLPLVGQRLSFEVETTDNGKKRARTVPSARSDAQTAPSGVIPPWTRRYTGWRHPITCVEARPPPT